MQRYLIPKTQNDLRAIVSVVLDVAPEKGIPYYEHGFKVPTFTDESCTELEEGFTQEQINLYNSSTIALFHAYPELEQMSYKLLALDNLEGIKRDSTLADKGLKGEKKYRKNDVLIWSSEKKYWFQDDGYPDGFRRITKLFHLDGSVADQWENFYELSEDDKEMFKKNQRELIFEYFKSQQPGLFNLLYTFFKEDIDRYVMKGGGQLAEILTDAAENHPVEIVKQTLSTEVPTQSGGIVTVLQGILYELV